jgi:hypothetical protein
MATVQRYVDTGSTAGGDGTTTATSGGTRAYASLSDWEANQGSTATDDYIVDCAATDTGSGNVADTAGSVNIDFAAITTGSVTIQQTGSARNTGNTFIDTGKYRLIINGTCIRPVKNTTLRGLQLDCTSTGGFTSAINLTSPASLNGLTIEYCRIRSAGRSCISTNASGAASYGGTNPFRNNVFVLSAGTACIDIAGPLHGSITYDLYQNTFYSNGSKPGAIFSGMGGSGTQALNVKNNVVANTTNPFTLPASGAVVTTTTDYNWTDDGADGTTNEQNLPAHGSTFTSAGTGTSADFSLLAALATGGQVGSITDDILGATRGSGADCDAGAFEFADGGGTNEGTGSGTVPSVTGAASGTPVITGSAAGTLPSATGAAAGSPVVSGSAAGTLSSTTGAASGTPVITGTGAGTVPSVTGSAANTTTGTGAGTLPSLTGSGVGTPVIVGSTDGTVPSLTGAASGAPIVTGIAAAVLPSLTGSASGTPIIVGSGAGTLPRLTGEATDGLSLEVPPTRGAYTGAAAAKATYTKGAGGRATYTGANT